LHTISGRVAALRHADKAMKVLVDMLTSPQHAVRVTAANSLLDRAYGKAPQALELTGKGGGPMEHNVTNDAEHFTSAIAGLAARAYQDRASSETEH
jgi:hypothetical protein